MNQSNNIHNGDHSEDQTYRDLFRSLPDPGPAYVAGRVMTHLRRRNEPVWRVRHAVWGVVASVTGLVLGFYFTESAIDMVNNQPLTTGDSYSELITGADDGLDQLVADLFLETEE